MQSSLLGLSAGQQATIEFTNGSVDEREQLQNKLQELQTKKSQMGALLGELQSLRTYRRQTSEYSSCMSTVISACFVNKTIALLLVSRR